MNTYSINPSKCIIAFNNVDERLGTFDRDYKHYGLFHRLMNFMREMGYTIEKDPETLKNYKRIAYCHWYGKKGDLEFGAEFYPAGFVVKFFQNVNFEDPHGGRYDFDKWEKMPYSLRMEMIRTMRHIREFMQQFPLKDISDPVCNGSEDEVKRRFVADWNHPQKTMDFDLRDLDGTPGSKDDSQNRDRDGKELRNGQVKYTRDYRGYLVRGRIYYDNGDRWVVILNKNDWIVSPFFELFDLQDSDVRGRYLPHRKPPKEYRQKMEILHEMKTSWLEKELRRRRRADRDKN